MYLIQNKYIIKHLKFKEFEIKNLFAPLFTLLYFNSNAFRFSLVILLKWRDRIDDRMVC